MFGIHNTMTVGEILRTVAFELIISLARGLKQVLQQLYLIYRVQLKHENCQKFRENTPPIENKQTKKNCAKY